MKSHWTPRYLLDRLQEKEYRRRNPDHPWLTGMAMSMLPTLLKKTDLGLEFGSGRSTLWFAAHMARLTSVEHNPIWYERTRLLLQERNCANVHYELHEREADERDDGADTAYVGVLKNFSSESLDFVLIDGIYRGACAAGVVDKIVPGGMIVVDNANLYIPSSSHAPNSIKSHCCPANEQWALFLSLVRGWRYIWTSNGVFDTAFYFKPPLLQPLESH